MQTVEMTPESVRAAAGALPEGVPIFMLNLLRYRAQADYGDRADQAPCSGREAYFQRYVPAFNQAAAQVGAADEIKILFAGSALADVVAPPGERWDDVAVVEYVNFAVFRRVVESRAYEAEAAFHRTAALADSRLIAMVKMALPG